MEVPSVNIPSAEHREHQARITARQALVEVRTKLVNTVRSYYRSSGSTFVKASPETLAKRVRNTLETLPRHVEQILLVLDNLNEQIAEADKALKVIANAEETCRVLQTMPGVGPITSICFAASIDKISRFESAPKLTSYVGLTPGENTTGFKTKRIGITKSGPVRVRWTLVQAAWSMVRTRPNDPLTRWFHAVAERRGKKIAIVALARKMAGILYAMWRDQRPYDPQKAVAVLAA